MNVEFIVHYRNSGFGLQTDALVLCEELRKQGYVCKISEMVTGITTKRRILRYLTLKTPFLDIVKKFLPELKKITYIHLETPDYGLLWRSGNHVLVPNQEWFDPSAIETLRHFSAIWCKTKLAQSLFSQLHRNCEYIGFRSLRSNISVKFNGVDPIKFMARVGKSPDRGGDALISLWGKHPEWPTLYLLIHPGIRTMPAPENVIYLDFIKNKDDFDALLSSIGFHIFISETEGFGHTLFEGIQAGAIMIATDAQPMNEIIDSESGILVGSIFNGFKKLSPKFKVNESDLERAVDRVIGMSREEIDRLSLSAVNRSIVLSKCFEELLGSAAKKLTDK